jgi:hypothetical protein
MSNLSDPLTVQQAVLRLLRYIGINSLTPATGLVALRSPVIKQSDIEFALKSINRALEDIELECEGIFKSQHRSAFFKAPRSVTVTATLGDSEMFVAEGVDGSMIGCSILVPGAAALNEIMFINTATSVLTCLHAFDGADAVGVVATIYGDAVLLPEEIRKVVAPVTIMPRIVMARAQSREAWYMMKMSMIPTIGRPTHWFDETVFNPDVDYLPICLRIHPAAPAALNTDFYADISIAKASMDDIGIDDNNDPGTTFTSLPAMWSESVMMPLAEQAFTKHPAFKNSEAKAEIKLEYDRAMRILNSSKINTSVYNQHSVFIK